MPLNHHWDALENDNSTEIFVKSSKYNTFTQKLSRLDI